MSIEAMKLALKAFKYADSTDHDLQRKAIIALEQAIALQNLTDTHQEMEVGDAYQRAWKLATAEQKQPVAVQAMIDWYNSGSEDWEEFSSLLNMLTAPSPRQPLTDEQADELVRRFARYELLRAVEAAHGIRE